MFNYIATNLFCLLHNLLFISLGILGIGFLIGFHELGHFLFCKLFHIGTPSFSIGFGPKLISKKIGDTEFSLSLLPLGGYVEIAGAAEVGQGDQKEAHSTDQNSFASKPFYQKLLVMLGGIFFNLMFAYTVFIALFVTDLPRLAQLFHLNEQPIIEHIEKNSAAEIYGLHVGDRIRAIDQVEVGDDVLKILQLLRTRGDQKTNITIERGSEIITLTVIPKKEAIPVPQAATPNKEACPDTQSKIAPKEANEANADTQAPASPKETIGSDTQEPTDKITPAPIAQEFVGKLGVNFALVKHYSFIEAIRQGIKLTNIYIKGTGLALVNIISRRNFKGLGGPIAMISQTSKSAEQGCMVFFILLALISINLAIFNLIPLPIFDGGQILFYSIEAIIGRPLSPKIREYIHIATWLLVLSLIIILSIRDISHLASPHIETVKQFLGFKS